MFHWHKENDSGNSTSRSHAANKNYILFTACMQASSFATNLIISCTTAPAWNRATICVCYKRQSLTHASVFVWSHGPTQKQNTFIQIMLISFQLESACCMQAARIDILSFSFLLLCKHPHCLILSQHSRTLRLHTGQRGRTITP